MNVTIEQRQSQRLILSPQMLQSVKLLQFSHYELQAYVAEELEKNPFLEKKTASNTTLSDTSNRIHSSGGGTGSSILRGGEAPNLESFLSLDLSLHQTLEQQFSLMPIDPHTRIVGEHIIRAITPDGYLGDSVELIAMLLGTNVSEVERVLTLVTMLEPTGVGARNLAECLSLQLRERDRLDPAMQALLANLPLMAKGDRKTLRQVCGVDDEDLDDMFAEIRSLDPKPGHRFDHDPVQIAIPDVVVQYSPEGGWSVQINDAILPRVLLNRSYYRELTAELSDRADRTFISEQLRAGNWLVQGLDQRIRTILNVATEIVKQQNAFFSDGIEHLKPLGLKCIADALEINESTVSRVTSNKFIETDRGIFPMKFFFPPAINGMNGEASHAADTVRYRIKLLIDAEGNTHPLSDGAIAVKLTKQDIKIARRTVAKYREALNIPSSVERGRQNAARRVSAQQS